MEKNKLLDKLYKSSLTCIKLNDLPQDLLLKICKREIKVSYMVEFSKIKQIIEDIR